METTVHCSAKTLLHASFLLSLTFLLLLASTSYLLAAEDNKAAFFKPPRLDYASLCVFPTKSFSSSPAEYAKNLTPAEQLKKAALLSNGRGNLLPDPEQAASLLESVILKGNKNQQATAKSRLAKMLLSGHGILKDEVRALELLEEALPSNPYTTGVILAYYYHKHKLYVQSQRYLQYAAAAGNPRAYLLLSHLYKEKLVSPLTPSIAHEMLRLGHNILLEKLARGQCNVLGDTASVLLSRNSPIQNEPLALEWLQAAVEAGDISASLRMAKFLSTKSHSLYNPSHALHILERASQSGSREAMYRLGKQLLTSDTPSALRWLEKAASHSHQEAVSTLISYYGGKYHSNSTHPQKLLHWLNFAFKNEMSPPNDIYDLAELYTKGAGVKKNIRHAFMLYQQAARKSSHEAMTKIGDAYKYGIGAKFMPISSYRFYRLAAHQGNQNAILSLINNYECGIGKTANLVLADYWRKRGIHAGSSKLMQQEIKRLISSKSAFEQKQAVYLTAKWIKHEAMKLSRHDIDDLNRTPLILMAILYEQGIGVPQDSKKSNWWKAMAIRKGINSAQGMLELADAYLQGKLFTKAPQKATLGLLLQAYQSGNKKAVVKLARFYEKNTVPTAENLKIALEYYKEAALLGIPSAQRKFGQLILRKTSGSLDDKEGLKWLGAAANAGDLDAILALAEYYASITNSLQPARRWLNKAARHHPCLFRHQQKFIALSELVNGGKSIDQLTLHAKKGYTVAMRELAKYYLAKNSPLQSVYWYKQAAAQHDSTAMLELGNMYFTGTALSASRSKALHWWKRAAAAGNHRAAQLISINSPLSTH